ncbi:hypothetical protein SteCoe_5078 [Stentor coeruleus]|uniref:Uncharacterized protein n=1 Tax=Stentor coeruleus TaxID=5963 RepID=A0A1R2CTA1_9CILI|nr:hypothetical protein SteCoe_5078 [Stentor coeruleus]
MATKGFESFDFSKSQEWLNYYENNVYPKPDYARLQKLKQKWYKEHIDKYYNPDPVSHGPQTNPSQNQGSSRTGQAYGSSLPQPSSMQKLQTLLFFLSVPAMFFGKTLHLIICGHLAGIIHYHNMPKMNLEYWKPVVSDDNLHSIAFALLFLVLPTNALWVIPVYLGTLVYVPDVIIRSAYFPQKIKDLANKFERKKLMILQSRADCEAWVGFGLIIFTILGYSHWISPIIYWQYTRMRYMLNHFTKITFANIRAKGDQMLTNKPGIGMVWEKLKYFCNWLCTVEANPQPSSCQIF